MLVDDEPKMLRTMKDNVGWARELGHPGNKWLALPYQTTSGLQHHNFQVWFPTELKFLEKILQPFKNDTYRQRTH